MVDIRQVSSVFLPFFCLKYPQSLLCLFCNVVFQTTIHEAFSDQTKGMGSLICAVMILQVHAVHIASKSETCTDKSAQEFTQKNW